VAVVNPGSQIQAQTEWRDIGAFRFSLKQRDSDATVELVDRSRSLFKYGFRSETILVCLHVSILIVVQA
jgi:hypothetical protein